jgi:hypothetical protein
MASYKVIQDIEAEDKLVGPLTLRQCIYAAITCLCLYICFLAYSKGAGFLMVFFLPIAAGSGFFAFPWQGEQPTEIWALARLRFMVKPRVRIWDQDGVKDLVTILVPKKIEIRRSYKDSLSQREVNSRLRALADTIDSRGWATRNAAFGFTSQWQHPTVAPVPGAEPVANVPNDDMFDTTNSVAQNFDAMLSASSAQQRQRVMQQINAPQQPQPSPYPQNYAQAQAQGPAPAPASYQPAPQPMYQAPQLPAPIMPGGQATNWFANGPAYPTMPQPQPTQPVYQTATAPMQAAPIQAPPIQAMPMPTSQQSAYLESDAPIAVAATPTTDEMREAEMIRQQNQAMAVNLNHMRVLQPAVQAPSPSTSGPSDDQSAYDDMFQSAPPNGTPEPVTHTPDPAILEFANNDDLDIATIARQANKQIKQSPDEVEIRLH